MTVKEEQISEAEVSMVLDTFMYMNYQEAREGTSLKQIVQDLANHPDYGGGGIHYGEYTVVSQAVQNEQIGSLTVECFSKNMGYDEGTAACTFLTPEQDTVFVVYRGTGDGEWPDNGIGMTEAITTQQKKALAYFDETVEYLDVQPEQRLIITGHSKGGNKAQFVTMETKNSELTDVCYSVDGQGFSDRAIDRWKSQYGEEEYHLRTQKLNGIYGENDYVNELGYTIIPREKVRYVKTPVEKENFAGYHDIKYMFASREHNPDNGMYETVFHGRKNADSLKQGELGQYAARLSKEMMELKPEKRDGCAAVLMQIMEMTGGRKKGINGEKLTIADFLDFTVSGLPLIAQSLLESHEGKNLLYSVMKKDSFSDSVVRELDIKVNYHKLFLQSDALYQEAAVVKKQIGELTVLRDELPGVMYGNVIAGHRLKKSINSLEELEKKMEKLAESVAQAAGCYSRWDRQMTENAEAGLIFKL